MRNIDGSVWMDNPVLQVVESAKDSPTGGSNFTLTSDVVGVDLQNGRQKTGQKVSAKRRLSISSVLSIPATSAPGRLPCALFLFRSFLPYFRPFGGTCSSLT